jgi:hypothetical protein
MEAKMNILRLIAIVAVISVTPSCSKTEYPDCYSPGGSSMYVVESGTMAPVVNANVLVFASTSWASEELIYQTTTSESGLCSWPCENKATSICVEAGDRYWDYCTGSRYELMQGDLRDRIYELRTKAWIKLFIPDEYFWTNNQYGFISGSTPRLDESLVGYLENGYKGFLFPAVGDVENNFYLVFRNPDGEIVRREDFNLIPEAGDTMTYYYPLVAL